MLVAGGRPLTAWDMWPEGGEGSGFSGGRGRVRRGKRGDRGGPGRGRGRGRGVRRGAPKEAEQGIIVVSGEQAEQGIFGIEHVVIPLPGRCSIPVGHRGWGGVGSGMIRRLVPPLILMPSLKFILKSYVEGRNELDITWPADEEVL